MSQEGAKPPPSESTTSLLLYRFTADLADQRELAGITMRWGLGRPELSIDDPMKNY
jgi:hypothetical protein